MKTKIFRFKKIGPYLMANTRALAQMETTAEIKVRFEKRAVPKGTVKITAASEKIIEATRERFSIQGVTLA